MNRPAGHAEHMNTIAIVDYGMGNLRSVAKAVEHVAPGRTVVVTADPAELAAAERIIVPGQGAMPDCMRQLHERGLATAVVAAAARKPFLGICIGLQMLFDHSEEGDVPGLGLMSGNVRHFPATAMHTEAGARLKVPHMGWNEVHQSVPHPLWAGIADNARFYFVHSYHCVPEDRSWVAATTDYGGPFVSVVARGNVMATQFHPEKSQACGMQLLKNFVNSTALTRF